VPTYQYRCTQCGRQLEVVQKFTDPTLTECEVCSGALRKVYNAVGVVFKGSGFYRTDSRQSAEKAGAKGSTTKADGSDGEKTPSEKKPGEKKPSESGSNGSAAGGSKEKVATAASSTGD
jgi:putative FmdB family regulatory protein